MSNSIWKTPDQKPERFRTVIFQSIELEEPELGHWDGQTICPHNEFESLDMSQITRWCYLDDLIAQADKAERSQKAIEWLVGGDTGISSKTMCAALFGATPKKSDMPHDADDFGRCLRFIRFMPDGTKDIVFKKLSDKPEWVEIGNRWDELVELYDQENWRGIYDILSAIRKEHRKPRPNEIFIGL